MQIRSKAYVQIVSQLRSLHRLIAPNQDPSTQEASPLLVFAAAVLTLLLAMLEIDLHAAELESLGLMGSAFSVDPMFRSP